MHFTPLLALLATLIPAATPVPAPSPQSAEIDVHLELTSKDLSRFFKEHKAKTNPHPNADAQPGQTLPYPFTLKGHLIQGLETIGPKPPPLYYQFPRANLGEQGILSGKPTTFRLQDGKLALEDKAVGLNGPFERAPISAILVHPQQALSFTASRPSGSEKTLLNFADSRFSFLGPKFVSGPGDRIEVGFRPGE